MHNLVPCNPNNDRQKELINTLSRSLTIDVGIPWSRTTLAINALATTTAVNGCLKATKWAYLVYWSTITIITVYPLEDGNPSIKSIEMSVHIWAGMGNGWSNPAGFIQSVLNLWQTSHYCKNSFTERLIWLGQYKTLLEVWKSFMKPKMPINGWRMTFAYYFGN